MMYEIMNERGYNMKKAKEKNNKLQITKFEIEDMRDKLNEIAITIDEDTEHSNLIKLSEKMDKLIVKYMNIMKR